MTCKAKHTKFQPSNEDWKCPECEKDNNHFVIFDDAEGAAPDCCELHSEDGCECSGCGYAASGDVVAHALKTMIQKAAKQNAVAQLRARHEEKKASIIPSKDLQEALGKAEIPLKWEITSTWKGRVDESLNGPASLEATHGSLTVTVHRWQGLPGWFVTCRELRIDRVELPGELQQAKGAALMLVANSAETLYVDAMRLKMRGKNV